MDTDPAGDQYICIDEKASIMTTSCNTQETIK